MYFAKYDVSGTVVKVGFGHTKTWVRMPDGTILSFAKHEAHYHQIRMCVSLWLLRNERKLQHLAPAMARTMKVTIL